MTNDDLIRAMDPFGGGLGACGEVCGAVIGGLAVIGLLFGRVEGGSPPDMNMWVFSQMFIRRFRKEITDGKILCRDIVAVNWTDPGEVDAFRQGEKFRKCTRLVGESSRLLCELIDRFTKGK